MIAVVDPAAFVGAGCWVIARLLSLDVHDPVIDSPEMPLPDELSSVRLTEYTPPVPAGQLTCSCAALTTIGTVTLAPFEPALFGPALNVMLSESPTAKLAVITLTVTQPLEPVRCWNLPALLTPSAVPLPVPLKLKAKLMSKLGIG